jgi:hypothetical protein
MFFALTRAIRLSPRVQPWECSQVFAPKVATGLSPGFQPWECVVWTLGSLAVIYCPEGGYRAQPRVSTLGTLKISEFALKGREADLLKLAPIAARKLTMSNRNVLRLEY